MPRAKPATKVLPYIRARIDDIRLMREQAEFVAEHTDGAKVAVTAVGRAELSIGISDDPTPSKHVVIVMNYFLTVKHAESDLEVIKYANRYQIFLTADVVQGIDDPNHVPIEAVQSYVDIAQRMATLRAQSTLLEMGLAGIQMPKPTSFSPHSPQAEAQKSKRVPKKKAGTLK